MLKWKDVEPLVLATLSDQVPSGSTQPKEYSDEELRIWWNNAQMRLATTKPYVRSRAYSRQDGFVVSLPENHYKPKAVMCGTKMPRISLDDAIEGVTGYYTIDDTLILANLSGLSDTWAFIYYAFYPDITGENSIVYAPRWSHEALANYVGMQAMAKEAIEDARYRMYATPVDAPGNPTHNPFLVVAAYYERRFYDIINAHNDDEPN